MKKLNKLNLVSLGDKQFSKQELINMKGGYGSGTCCGCACKHNTVASNNVANYEGGHYDSIGGGAVVCHTHEPYQQLPNCY